MVFRSFPCNLQTIKAITLERMGRAEESLAVCRKVMAQGAPALCNENVLHDLEQVLARLGHGTPLVLLGVLPGVSSTQGIPTVLLQGRTFCCVI